MPSFGNLFASLTLESASFMTNLKAAQKGLAETQRTFQRVGGQLQKAGAVLSVGLTAPFAAVMSKAIPAAIESREAMAQVQAGLKSMGDASGRSAEQLKGLARQLQSTSTFDDDEILRKVTANLLTFGQVSGPVFDRAQQAAVDMASRLKMDLQPATIAIGKALNDPIKGVTALSRVGIQFTESQKDAIKAMVATNDVAGAQAIILAELERQFKGSAQAERDAAPGSDTVDAWRDFNKIVGNIALDVLPPLTDILTKVLNAFNFLPGPVQTVVVGIAAVGAALGPVLIGLGTLVKTVGLMLPGLASFSAGLLGVAAAEGTATGATYALGVAVRVALPWLAAISGAVAVAYAAWEHWDKIKPIIDRAIGWVKGLYEGVKTWLVDKLRGLVKGVTDTVGAMVKPFKDAYTAVVGNSYVPDMVDGIAHQFTRLQSVMVDPAIAANDNLASSFAETAKSVAYSFEGMVRSIKSGDIGSAIGGVLDVVSRIAGLVGGGGGGVSLSTARSNIVAGLSAIPIAGARKNGGPVMPGRNYLVGERGPEILRMGGRGGSIVANNDMMAGGGGIAHIVPSPYFDVVVDGRVVSTGAPMMASGMRSNNRAMAMRARQRLA